MKCTLIIMAFLIYAIFAGASQADDFITFDNPAMSREERIIKAQVEKHRHIDLTVREYASNHEYIHKDMNSILEREGFINVPRKPKGEEIYAGR